MLIRAAEAVIPSTASANRDESVFPHAHQLDTERPDIFQFDVGATDVWANVFPVGDDRRASRARTQALLSRLATAG